MRTPLSSGRAASTPVQDVARLHPGYTPLAHFASSRETPPMPTGVFDSLLLGHVWGTDELRAIFSDESRVQKWFDYEAALALAQAELGIIPHAAADEIAARAKVGNVDLAAVGAEIRRIKHPLVPALRALQAACAGDHGEYLHFGPTTQDVLDTGMVLQLKQAHALILRDLKQVGRELYRLAEAHRATPMAGRTHGVQALPITFGHKCAIWLAEAHRNHDCFTRSAEPKIYTGVSCHGASRNIQNS